MSHLAYGEKRMPWGKIREYETTIPSITLYQRIYAESEIVFPVESYEEAVLYVGRKGSAYIHTEEGKIEVGEEGIVIIPPRKKHSVSISKGGVLDLIKISYQIYTIISPLEERLRRREYILKPKLPINLS